MVQEPKRQERGKRRIAEILDASAELFADVGYEAATTNAIAARAGISPGSLYQFFPNKEAIAEALARRYVAELEATHDIALDTSIAHLPLDQLVDHVADPLIDFNLSHPSMHALLNGSDVSPTLAALTQELHNTVLRRLEALFASRAPKLPAKQRERAALVSVQIFKAVLPLVLSSGRTERTAVIAELKAALRGYLGPVVGDAAIRAPATSRRK